MRTCDNGLKKIAQTILLTMVKLRLLAISALGCLGEDWTCNDGTEHYVSTLGTSWVAASQVPTSSMS